MGAPKNLDVPWAVALLKLLADGEWHPYQEALEHACVLISANLGWEKGEYYRAYHFKRKGQNVPPRRFGSDKETIHTGRRIIMGRCMTVMESRKLIEIDYVPFGKRRKPDRVRLGVMADDC